MLFRSFLRYMRNQPKVVRNQYALAFSGVFTGLIALVWIFTNAHAVTGGAVAEAEVDRPGPFSSLFKQIGAQFATVRGSVDDLQAELGSATSTDTADPRELILTDENKDAVSTPDTTPSTTPQGTYVETSQYIEVQIATTTRATTSASSSVSGE